MFVPQRALARWYSGRRYNWRTLLLFWASERLLSLTFYAKFTVSLPNEVL
jgi:hypothetical protein